MSQRVFVTFLGIGNPYSKEGELGYASLTYTFEDGSQSISPFAQVSTVEWIQPQNIDKYIVLLTKESEVKHWDALKADWLTLGVNLDQVQTIQISTDQSKEAQWDWFKQLFHYIEREDTLYFDFTHGFRSVPILFSTAIGFLQKSKRIALQHAFYGYLEDKDKATGQIIDMVDFYRINDWADGVASLVQSADPSQLNRLAEKEQEDSPFQAITDPKLIAALDELTLKLQSVDVENVGLAARKVCTLIAKKHQPESNAPDQYLLEMLLEKFQLLSSGKFKRYDKPYFQTQLTLIQVLIEHQFLMQAFTAMRELIGTIGVSRIFDVSGMQKQSTEYHRSRADIFCSMCQFPVHKWKFESMLEDKKGKLRDFHHLKAFWETMSEEQHVELQSVAKTIAGLRNGFDHAWLGKKGVPKNVKESCDDLYQRLRRLIDVLIV